MPAVLLRLSRSVVVGLFLCLVVMGSEGVVGQGLGVGAFSRMGFDARGLAMGNALVAAPSTDVSPYYNPALLPTATGQRVAGSAAVLAYDRQLQSLEFTTPIGPTAGVGLGLIHAGVSNIDGRNADGGRTQTLSTDEFALSLAFGNRFAERLSVGIGFTLYQSDVVPETSPVRGFGVDLGLSYRVTSQLKVAAAVSDLLAKYEWDTSSLNGQSRTDRFPVRVQVGGSYTLLDGRVHLLGEVESRFVGRDRQVVDRVIPTSGGPRQETRTESVLLHTVRGRMGAAYRPVDILALRAGFDRIGVDGTSGLRPTAGFGLRHELGDLKVRLGYAAALEPYVRTVMHFGTIEVFL
ncbi:MAG TPA: PorV/PorQ family protein [Salinibacter sp.]|nr:PorV/PorQ family protein [Salinibacter sp.]